MKSGRVIVNDDYIRKLERRAQNLEDKLHDLELENIKLTDLVSLTLDLLKMDLDKQHIKREQ